MPAAFFLMIAPRLAVADGLDALIELGRGQAEIQKAYAEETKAYGRLKKGVDEGIVKKGTARKEVRDRYGEPVISYTDFDTKREAWVYKPATTDFMGGGTRICLYFDGNGALDEIVVTEKSGEK